MRHDSTEISLTRIITGEDDRPDNHPWLNNALSLGAVWVVGVAGWFISYKMGAWDVDSGLPDTEKTTSKFGLALGYFSAVAYLWYVGFFGSFPLVSPYFPSGKRKKK